MLVNCLVYLYIYLLQCMCETYLQSWIMYIWAEIRRKHTVVRFCRTLWKRAFETRQETSEPLFWAELGQEQIILWQLGSKGFKRYSRNLTISIISSYWLTPIRYDGGFCWMRVFSDSGGFMGLGEVGGVWRVPPGSSGWSTRQILPSRQALVWCSRIVTKPWSQ